MSRSVISSMKKDISSQEKASTLS